jgi:hypothetical protein
MMYMCANGTYSICQHIRHHKYGRKCAGLQLSLWQAVFELRDSQTFQTNKTSSSEESHTTATENKLLHSKSLKAIKSSRAISRNFLTFRGRDSLKSVRNSFRTDTADHIASNRREIFKSYTCTVQSLRWETLHSR